VFAKNLKTRIIRRIHPAGFSGDIHGFRHIAGCINAGAGGLQVIVKMENKIYPKHEKGIVEFTHKKHVVDYKGACGDCHHDWAGFS
jgi:hypothetical protein